MVSTQQWSCTASLQMHIHYLNKNRQYFLILRLQVISSMQCAIPKCDQVHAMQAKLKHPVSPSGNTVF